MNEINLAQAREVLENAKFLTLINKEFDRAFEMRLSEVEGKIIIQFRETDSGLEYMTLGDCAALLQMPRKAIRQMTEARAQQSTINPLPYIRIGKNLRFRRSAIIGWLERKGAEATVLPPVKGKRAKVK